MQLKNKLYTITAKETDGKTSATFELLLDPECFIYKAHFPGQPITPGVCIVQTAKELLEEMTGKALDIVFAKNVKFLSVVTPADSPTLVYNINKVAWSEDGQEVKAQMAVSSSTEAKAKVSLVCRIHD